MLHVLTVRTKHCNLEKKTFVCGFWVKCLCADDFVCVWCSEWYQCGSSWSVCTECPNRGGWQSFHVSPHADVSGYCVIHKEKGDTVASSWIHQSVCVCAVRVIYNFNLKLACLFMSALWICVIIFVTTRPALFLSFSFSHFSSLACLPSVL